MTRTPARTAHGGRDALLAGAPAVQRLLRDVESDPARAGRVAVVGPGGHGKTVLYDALASTFDDAGVPLVRDLPAGPVAPDAALLVDDAHLLDDD